jgi:hypothetical protein
MCCTCMVSELSTLCQAVGNHGLFFSEFKQRVGDHYRQMWFDGRSSSPTLVYYDQFKGLLEPEKYLSCVVRKYFRIALTRYRTSCHTLEIDIGRRNNITREEKVCKVCMYRILTSMSSRMNSICCVSAHCIPS